MVLPQNLNEKLFERMYTAAIIFFKTVFNSDHSIDTENFSEPHSMIMFIAESEIIQFKNNYLEDHKIIQRAGRFTWPQGKLTLTMNSNWAVKKDLLHFMGSLQKAA